MKKIISLSKYDMDSNLEFNRKISQIIERKMVPKWITRKYIKGVIHCEHSKRRINGIETDNNRIPR